jgi:sulfur transfer protein SufE
MLLGKTLPALPAALKCQDNLLHGCTSKVWLIHQYDASENKLWLALNSDARIIQGLGALVLAALQGRSPVEITHFDMEAYFSAMGLMQHLSPSRSNGLLAIVKAIRDLADRYRQNPLPR